LPREIVDELTSNSALLHTIFRSSASTSFRSCLFFVSTIRVAEFFLEWSLALYQRSFCFFYNHFGIPPDLSEGLAPKDPLFSSSFRYDYQIGPTLGQSMHAYPECPVHAVYLAVGL